MDSDESDEVVGGGSGSLGPARRLPGPMDSDDDSCDVVGDSFASLDPGAVGRVVLCGVIGRGARRIAQVSNGSKYFARGGRVHPLLKCRSSYVERMLVERGIHIEDGLDDQLLLGIGLFRCFALLVSQQTQWHSKECTAMYSALATKTSEPRFPAAILVPVVVAAEFSNPIPYRTTDESTWWLLGDWRETLMMDGVTTVFRWWARPHSFREVICVMREQDGVPGRVGGCVGVCCRDGWRQFALSVSCGRAHRWLTILCRDGHRTITSSSIRRGWSFNGCRLREPSCGRNGLSACMN